MDVTIRCVLDGLLLPAVVRPHDCPPLLAFDGEEGFAVEAIEALYYEMVAATPDELLHLEQAHYRMLRPAEDFQLLHC
jgi:hypothetical protein